MTNTAIVASNIVGIRLVRAISVCKVWTKGQDRTGLQHCYSVPCDDLGTFVINSTCSKNLACAVNIIIEVGKLNVGGDQSAG